MKSVYKQFAKYYDSMYSWKDYKAESERIRALIKMYKTSRGREILDAACGTGNHIQYLKKYFNITGLDMDLDMLLSEYVERGIRDFRLDDLDIKAYWFDFGNGLQSIAIAYEDFNSTNYTIYSGDKELTNLLKNDLDSIINSKKYNL